jgi:hypothetical protein
MSKSSLAFIVATAAFAPLFLAAAPASAEAMKGDAHKDPHKAVCPVTGKAIPEGKGVKVTVRGQEYTVIDKAAADKLTANPDKFLNADGMPKNGEKKAPKGQ